jgi:hypothetical protein
MKARHADEFGARAAKQAKPSPTPAFSRPEMVAWTSVSGHWSRLWPCTSGELAAEVSTGRVALVGVLPVALNGDRYGLLLTQQALWTTSGSG